MSISIQFDGSGSEQELRSLHGWLLDDPDVRRHAKVLLSGAPPSDGEMGSALEVIKLITDGGFQTLTLALAYVSWRSTRPAKPHVTIERDGTKIVLSDDDPEAIEKIVRMLESDRP
ncbi:hypothetical protein SAMN05216276_1001311 [Streptosporangium subroseum]|uniref:Uncharacterized protein n=2 Tax=Streptosporangium subroseum TaxID=106412 RepID=A0A239ADM4_9ACTN|nr:hypothetical protein SAMN05216276_1001311 [Streptosporangium subroseum]